MMREHKSVSQAQQLKELEASFALATKEMQSAQAKMAVETTKEVNNDPKLKTKAEKDRRLKEKQAANTKKIIDERKSKGMKENKVRTKLQNVHKKELEDLSKWIKDEIAACTEEELDWKAADRREAFV